MDWSGVTAVAAVIAAVGAVGALLAAGLQLQQDRLSREVDYYRKLTPFLSFEVVGPPIASFGGPAVSFGGSHVDVYADGAGYAYNIIVTLDQIGSSTNQNMRIPGEPSALRYLREGQPGRIDFSTQLGPQFLGYLTLKFKDTFGIWHEAQQAVNNAGGSLGTTDAIQWKCGADCRVHVIRPAPPPGILTRFAQWARLY